MRRIDEFTNQFTLLNKMRCKQSILSVSIQKLLSYITIFFHTFPSSGVPTNVLTRTVGIEQSALGAYLSNFTFKDKADYPQNITALTRLQANATINDVFNSQIDYILYDQSGLMSSSLPDGIYILNQTQGTGVGVINLTITSPYLSKADINVLGISACGLSDGQIIATPGGTAPYTYAWSGQNQTDSISENLVGGAYNVTITDANNCNFISSDLFILSSECVCPLVICRVQNNPTNCGFSVGKSTIVLRTGVQPYALNLTAIINFENAPTFTGVATQQNTYFENTDRINKLNVTTGNLPIIITTNVSSKTITSLPETVVISNLLSQTYLVTVTGVNGCATYETVAIHSFPAYNININYPESLAGLTNESQSINGIACIQISDEISTILHLEKCCGSIRNLS